MSKPSASPPLPLLLRWATLLAFIALSVVGGARAQDGSGGSDIPAKPTRYFNDYALATDGATAERLNTRLADFERETSNQLIVAIFPKLKTDTDIADFAQRTFRAWKPGQAGRDNGAILFVFIEDRKARIQTGRGLEGAIPDALARRIIGDEIAPKFRAGDISAGLTAGVEGMIAAAKGEYQGTGKTVADSRRRGAGGQSGGLPGGFLLLLFFGFILFTFIGSRRSRRGGVFDRGGYRGMGGAPIILPMGGWGGGGGSGGGFGGGGGGGGDSGGFMGGGGDSGGGGASGDW